MKLRIFLACLACRLARRAANLLGRGGTNLPGEIALRVFPDVLRHVAAGVDSVLVTGTNGKTTTVKLLVAALESLGIPTFTNRSGANLKAGITAEYILNATLFGKPRRRHAVIECDEAAMKLVSGAIAPRAIVVTNLFRDQLDRYGEVTNILAEIREGIRRAPGCTVVVNADCSLCASLASDLPNRSVCFGVELDTGKESAVSDAPRCLRCGSRYVYRSHTFAHLGDFCCPDCGYTRPERDISVTAWEPGRESSRFTVHTPERDFECSIALPALYNVYNGLAVLAALRSLGLDVERGGLSLGKAAAGFGRMELMHYNGNPIRIILVKNPAGCDRALDYLKTVEGDYLPIFCLNDRPSDGIDVSWIWDVDVEDYLTSAPDTPAVYGSRANELRVRMKYAGADDSRIRVLESLDALLTLVKESEKPVYILPNYTTMLTVRDAVAKLCGEESFWK